MADAGEVIDRTIVVMDGLTCVIPMLNVVVSRRSQRPGIMKRNTDVFENEIGLSCLNIKAIAQRQATKSSPTNPIIV